MNILMPENKTYDVDNIIDYAPDIMFSILNLNFNNPEHYDYYFKHINNVVSFNSLSVDLQIGKYTIKVPLNWQILLGLDDSTMIESCTIENLLNMVEPHAYVYNPISSPYASFEPVKILRVYTTPIKWQVPYLLDKELLTLPLRSGEKPPCAYFADENTKIKELHLGIDI